MKGFLFTYEHADRELPLLKYLKTNLEKEGYRVKLYGLLFQSLRIFFSTIFESNVIVFPSKNKFLESLGEINFIRKKNIFIFILTPH